MDDIIVNYGLYAAYILVALAIILVIVFPIINSISNPKSLLGSAIGIIGIAIIFFIGWSISGSEEYTRFGVTEGFSKVIGGALITVYILGALAILGIVFSEISKIFR